MSDSAVHFDRYFTAADEPASGGIGSWLSAALDDPTVSEQMKDDIRAWFDAVAPLLAAVDSFGGPDDAGITITAGELRAIANAATGAAQ